MLNPDKYDIIKKLSVFLNQYNIRFYLVGGAVRDMLSGLEPVDFDFAAEVDENMHLLISEAIKKAFNIKDIDYSYNKHYHTCKFILDGLDIDFIMCRREVYEEPGCIPSVAASDIYDDLKRRDYSINAIALSLNNKDYGNLVDPLNGSEDVSRSLLRILHQKSFYDDPTRIFRGIKYAARLDFSFEKLTSSIISGSLINGCMSCLKCGRIKQEIDMLLLEKCSLSAVEYLKGYDIFKYLSGKDITIQTYNDQAAFNRLSLYEKYAVLFYNNTKDSLLCVKNMLGLGASWLASTSKLNELQGLSSAERRHLYYYLFKYCKNISDCMLLFLFPEDHTIINYVENRSKLSIVMSEIETIDESLRNEYIINKKIEALLKF